ncbi:Uncharacterised protein [uncultured archaeon]|nr:Uncharacterised protein [uncultured archaeon]
MTITALSRAAVSPMPVRMDDVMCQSIRLNPSDLVFFAIFSRAVMSLSPAVMSLTASRRSSDMLP